MAKQAVRFENAEGLALEGTIHWPLGETRAMVLFAHCFTCTANVRAAVGIARALNEVGFAVLAFDFTGLGASEGEFADSNFSSNVTDLEAAAEYLSREHRAPEVLIGHSLGGTAALAAARRVPSCRAVVTIGAPARAAHVAHLLAADTVHERGVARVDIGGRPFLIKRQLLEDIERQAEPEALRGLRRALLVMHSPHDEIVSIDNAGEIFTHALHPKSFVSLDHADHLLSRDEDIHYAARVIAAWAGRFLDADDEDLSRARPNPPGVIAETGQAGFTTELRAGRHRLTADEPVDFGGADLGPTPYELLGAALASCTSMTLQMYARHKGLDLEAAMVEVTHDKIHAEDCANCETKTGKIDRFSRKISLTGRLDAATRQRLMEIADRCPVHRSLSSEISIEAALEPSSES